MKLSGILAMGILFVSASFIHAQSTNRCRELVQANGSILNSSNRPITFSVRANLRGGVATGRFTFRDHQGGTTFASANLTEYKVLDEASRQLTFTSGTNENTVTAVVLICDFGRGRDDAFGAVLPGYDLMGNLKRGNVILRRTRCGD